jgi:hypothetical protein
MSLDLAAVLRRRKPEKRSRRLATRPATVRASAATISGRLAILIPDTCVYIDAAAGRLPLDAQALLRRAVQHHSSVCLGELAAGLGNMPPEASGYAAARMHYVGLMRSVPPGRTIVPDDGDWLEAGVLAGTLARLQDMQPHQRKDALNDALIYVSAAKAGAPVLTANADFDLLQQLHPAGSVIFY